MQAGDQYLNNGDYDRAASTFKSAIRAAAQTREETTVSLQLKKILPALRIGATTTIDIHTQATTTQATTKEHGHED